MEDLTVMPATKKGKPKRVSVLILKGLIDRVDELVGPDSMWSNRQQFVECALREKIDETVRLKVGLETFEKLHAAQNQHNRHKADTH